MFHIVLVVSYDILMGYKFFFTLKIRSKCKFWKAKFSKKRKSRRKLFFYRRVMVIVTFYFSCFLCDRSSRWDSELRAQLPWKPNSRGDWAPVGGRTRRAKRRGSCQGRPDSGHHIGLQYVLINRLTMALCLFRAKHRGETEEKIMSAIKVELDRREIDITGIVRIFPYEDDLVRVHLFRKVSVIDI